MNNSWHMFIRCFGDTPHSWDLLSCSTQGRSGDSRTNTKCNRNLLLNVYSWPAALFQAHFAISAVFGPRADHKSDHLQTSCKSSDCLWFDPSWRTVKIRQTNRPALKSWSVHHSLPVLIVLHPPWRCPIQTQLLNPVFLKLLPQWYERGPGTTQVQLTRKTTWSSWRPCFPNHAEFQWDHLGVY